MSSSARDMDVVSSLRLAIAARLGNDRFDLWFGRCEIAIGEDRLLIQTPCDFTAHWLRSHFRSEIQQACQSAVGKALDIQFHVRESAGPTPDREIKSVDAGAAIIEERSQELTKSPTAKSSSNKTTNPAVTPKRKFATLESFVAGHSNQVALTSARMVAEQIGRFSPLLIWGPPGNGKSHLLEGIWSAARKRQLRCLHLTAQQFTAFFLAALHGGGLPNFRRRYRNLDLLVIEDLQFLINKQATINELVYTIDAVMRDGKQLVFSASRSLAELSALGPDLVNRLSAGMVAGVQAPDEAARLTIVRKLAYKDRIPVSDDVLQLVAQNIQHDVRRLRGAIHRLQLYAEAHGERLTVSSARMALSDFFQYDSPTVQLRDIERAVCNEFSVKVAELKSSSRARPIAQARMLAMWLARKHTKAALSEIGEYFGRSHSTVVSSEKRVNEWIDQQSTLRIGGQDWPVAEAISRLEQRLRIA